MSAIKANKEAAKLAEYITSRTGTCVICQIETKDEGIYTVFYDENTDTYEMIGAGNEEEDSSIIFKGLGRKKATFELIPFIQNQKKILW